MTWDPFYGKQSNPYSVKDFRMILKSLQETCTLAPTEELKALILITKEALETEQEEE